MWHLERKYYNNEKKIKKESNGIKVNLSLLALKYEKDPITLAKIFCSSIEDSIKIVFPSNGNTIFNEYNEDERKKFLKTFLNEVIDICKNLRSLCNE